MVRVEECSGEMGMYNSETSSSLEYEVDDTLRDMRTSAHQYRINDTAKSRANRSS